MPHAFVHLSERERRALHGLHLRRMAYEQRQAERRANRQLLQRALRRR